MSLRWFEELAIETIAEENNVTIDYVKEHLDDFFDDVYGLNSCCYNNNMRYIYGKNRR